MRIIAGRLGGRQFKAPQGRATHPMSDKVRGALFNSLGDITGLTVLDPFAGSGALGFEAVSRGAGSVLLIEKDRSAQLAISDNIKDLAVADQVHLVKAGAGGWLHTATDKFDIILLDPPYDKLQYDLLEELAGRLRAGGHLVLSWPPNTELPVFKACELVRSKDYGDATLQYYLSIAT